MYKVDKITKLDLDEFVAHCHELFSVDTDAFYKEIRGLYNWHKGGEIPPNIKMLQDLWYNSLALDNPLWQVYDSPFYLADAWACWKIYSRSYLREISRYAGPEGKTVYQEIGNVAKIIDLGCGIGYTTLAIEEMFPYSKVWGTNLKGTKQWELNQKLGVPVAENVAEIGPVDLLFAFEYFEHFQDPVSHLQDLIKTCDPKYLLIASSFGTTSIGHFPEQLYKGEKVPSKGFGRIFNRELKKLGYEPAKTRLWNNKPALWRRKEN